MDGGHNPLRWVLSHCVVIADPSLPLFVWLHSSNPTPHSLVVFCLFLLMMLIIQRIVLHLRG